MAAARGPLRPSLFDDRDMAEITCPDYPGERLVVCKNPLLAEERARKRDELLAITEKELARISDRVQRARKPLRGGAAAVALPLPGTCSIWAKSRTRGV